MFKKVLYNTGAQILGKVFTASITLLVTLLIGRALGPAGYGEFTKVFVFIGYFYTFADFGLNSIFIKLAQKNALGLLKILLGLRLILAVFLAIAAVLIVLVLPYDASAGTGFSPLVKTGVIIGSLTIITQALFTTANAYFQKILRYDLSTLAAIAGSLVILTVALLVAVTKSGLLGYVVSYVAGGFTFVLIAYFLIFGKTKQVISPVFSKGKSKEILRLAYPVGLALIFNLIYFRIDVFILANFRSAEEVGLYGLAYQFFEAALAIPIFFANAIYPILTRLYQTSVSEFQRQFKNWLAILLLISAILTIALIVIAFFIPIIYDSRFAGSVLALQVLAVGLPFFFISALLWHMLIIYGRQRYLVYVYGAGAIVNLAANLAFIPVFGFIAAALTTIISEGLIMLFLFLVLKIAK